jgi:hypothetical protein
LIKNNILSSFFNKNIATLVFVAIFFFIWKNPSDEMMKNKAESYILSKDLKVSQSSIQEFLNQNFRVENYLLFSISSMFFLEEKQFIGVGFLAYAQPREFIYQLFLEWKKPLLENDSVDPTAAFIKLNGDVNIKHFDRALFNDAYIGEGIYDKDTVSTGEAPSFSALQYVESKSIIKIKENTTFKLNQNESRDELDLINGVLINNINNIKNRSFQVKTSIGTASVKGTIFAVKLDSSKGIVQFIGKTGSFIVESAITGEVLIVKGRQKVIASTDGTFILEPSTSSDFPIDPTVKKALNNNNSIIRDYDFGKLKESIYKEELETGTTLFNANILKFPSVTSSVIQIIEKGEQVNVLPLYRDGFFIISDKKGDAIGYIDEFDISFQSEKIINRIKKYSSRNFLDSKTLTK